MKLFRNKLLLPFVVVCFVAAAFALCFFNERCRNSSSVIPLTVTSARQDEPLTATAEATTVAVTTSAATSTLEQDASVMEQSDVASLVNLNTADESELVTLSGIGEVIAKRIIAYREENGGFDSIDELTEVSGIGEKKLAAIRDFITV